MGRLIDTDEYEKRIKPYDTEDVMDKALYNFAHNNLITTPTAQPEIIHCRDCKHRPKATRADEKVFFGFSVEFPDEKCPCQCGDGWYNWYPKDDFYCGYAERAEEIAQPKLAINLQPTCNRHHKQTGGLNND